MMIAVFIVVLVILVILYLASKGKYNEFIEPLDEKEYRMKNLIPMGLFLLDKVKYKYSTKYDRNLLTKLAALHESKYSYYYLQVHWGNKIAFVLLMFLVLSFIGAAMGKADIGFIVFSVVVIVGIIYFTDNELNEKLKKRHTAIQLDFPDFLNKLILLINAGMTVPRAWEKVTTDNKNSRPLYDELNLVMADIRGGKPEAQAYEDFAKRCRTPEITKFITVILQNMKKGNSEMVSILRLQARDCWEMRKHAAKRLGEEASTKMLFPMMIMFLAILIIVAVPAVLSMQGAV